MAYYAQRCDSYFVESHDSQERVIRDGIRERERQKKQQIQASIAEELSLLTSDEYRDDIQQHMRTMEVNHLCHNTLVCAKLSNS